MPKRVRKPRGEYRKRRSWTDEDFIKAIQENDSVAGVHRALGLKCQTGGAYLMVWTTVQRLGLDTSHWKGQGHLKGKSHNWAKRRPLSEVLVEGSTYKGPELKKRLVKEGHLVDVCAVCMLQPTWNGKPLVLQLDHINGVHFDNRLENLRVICPNCHTQTSTFGARNHGVYRRTGVDKSPPPVKVSRSRRALEPKPRPLKIVWPSLEELKTLVWGQALIKLAPTLGVTDNAIRKRCRKLGIALPPAGYFLRKH